MLGNIAFKGSSSALISLLLVVGLMAACGAPTATPAPTSTPTPIPPTSTPTPSPTPTSSFTPTPTPTSTPTPTPTPSYTPTPTPPPTETPTPTPSPTPAPTRTSPPTATPGLSSLSGGWTGTVTVFRVGQQEPIWGPAPVWMTWAVNDAGDVTISEGPQGDPNTPTWAGEVTADLRVSLGGTFPFFAGADDTNPFHVTAHYDGTIRREAGAYKLDIEVLLEVSPDTHIRRVYAIQKSR